MGLVLEKWYQNKICQITHSWTIFNCYHHTKKINRGNLWSSRKNLLESIFHLNGFSSRNLHVQSNQLISNLFSTQEIFYRLFSISIKSTDNHEQLCSYYWRSSCRPKISTEMKQLQTNFADKTISVNITGKIWILWDFFSFPFKYNHKNLFSTLSASIKIVTLPICFAASLILETFPVFSYLVQTSKCFCVFG